MSRSIARSRNVRFFYQRVLSAILKRKNRIKEDIFRRNRRNLLPSSSECTSCLLSRSKMVAVLDAPSQTVVHDVFQYAGQELPDGVVPTLSSYPQEELAGVLLWLLKNTYASGDDHNSWYWVPDNYLDEVSHLSSDLSTLLSEIAADLPDYESDTQLILFWDPEEQDYLLQHQGGETDVEFSISEAEALEYLDFVKDKGVYNVHCEQVSCPVGHSVPI